MVCSFVRLILSAPARGGQMPDRAMHQDGHNCDGQSGKQRRPMYTTPRGNDAADGDDQPIGYAAHELTQGMPGRKRPIVQPSPQKQDGPKAAEDDPKNVLQKMEHERPQKYLRSLCQPHASASRLSLRLRRSGSFQLECSAIRRASASRSQSVSSMAKATPAGSSCAVRPQSKKGPGSLFRPGAINS